MAAKIANLWLQRAKDIHNIEYILSADESDPQIDCYKAYFPAYLIVNSNNSCVEAINKAAIVANGDLLVVVSDDFECPTNWDELLLQELSDKKDFLAKTQDGCQPWIITLPIMDRQYYNRFGYIYYPGYEHMFCDTEMTHVGHLLGRVIDLPISFPHKHYTQAGGAPKDALNQKNDNTWAQGEKLYLDRCMINFGFQETQKVDLPNHHKNWLQQKGIKIDGV